MEELKLKESIKGFFKRFTWFELTLLITGLVAIVTMSIIVKSSWITIIYSIFGVIYTVLLASKFKVAILFGVVQVSFYIAQSVIYKNWGEVILNCAIVLPIILASVITWFTGKDKSSEKVTKTHLKTWEWGLLAGIFVVIAISFYFILNALETQNTIVACISCAFTACAHYLMLRKSQWMFVAFIGVNIMMIILWLLPIVQGGGLGLESASMLVTFVVYNVSNIMGIINWTKENKNNNILKENNVKNNESNNTKLLEKKDETNYNKIENYNKEELDEDDNN